MAEKNPKKRFLNTKNLIFLKNSKQKEIKRINHTNISKLTF